MNIVTIYIGINIIGTTLGIMIGKHGKGYVTGSMNKHWLKRNIEIGLYYAIGALIWTPTLAVRIKRSRRIHKQQWAQA